MGDLQDKAKSEEELAKALQGVQLALIPAGVPRKPGMTRDDLFNTNAGTIPFDRVKAVEKLKQTRWRARSARHDVRRPARHQRRCSFGYVA